MKTLLVGLCLLVLAHTAPARADEERISLTSGAVVGSHRLAAQAGGPVVLWFTGQYGPLQAERDAAAQLAAQGMEVWLTDWLAPYFLPQDAHAVAEVPEADLGEWLEAMRQRHADRPLVLVASGHAGALPLRAAAAWQARFGAPAPVAGAILLGPLLYREAEPGGDAEYLPVVAQTRLRLAMLVPMSSAGYWWREAMQAAFEAAGSRVHLAVLPGLRDRFYHRDDANAQEQAAGARLGEILAPHITALCKETHP